MSLKQLLEQGKLKQHKTSKEEIGNLLQLIKRDIKDAGIKNLSSDRKFATAYNATLQAATILLYCKGYKTRGIGHHFTIFQSMKEILNSDYYDLADYFDSCRVKRNITDYMSAGTISESDDDELLNEAKKFFKFILKWLRDNHPEYIE